MERRGKEKMGRKEGDEGEDRRREGEEDRFVCKRRKEKRRGEDVDK